MKNLKAKVEQYNTILKNTDNYRTDWKETLKSMITSTLEKAIKETKAPARIDLKSEIENLEVIALNLGHDTSGIAEKIPDSQTKRPYLKSNGALVYQQLFNGKVMIMIMYPYIENYGEPRPPKTVEILRPHEFSEETIIKNIEDFFTEIIEWEDFDDDLPENMPITRIGFGNAPEETEIEAS